MSDENWVFWGNVVRNKKDDLLKQLKPLKLGEKIVGSRKQLKPMFRMDLEHNLELEKQQRELLIHVQSISAIDLAHLLGHHELANAINTFVNHHKVEVPRIFNTSSKSFKRVYTFVDYLISIGNLELLRHMVEVEKYSLHENGLKYALLLNEDNKFSEKHVAVIEYLIQSRKNFTKSSLVIERGGIRLSLVEFLMNSDDPLFFDVFALLLKDTPEITTRKDHKNNRAVHYLMHGIPLQDEYWNLLAKYGAFSKIYFWSESPDQLEDPSKSIDFRKFNLDVRFREHLESFHAEGETLTVIDLKQYSMHKGSPDFAICELIRHHPNITTLILPKGIFESKSAILLFTRIIRKLKFLETLDLQATGLNDAALVMLLPALNSLPLTNLDISGNTYSSKNLPAVMKTLSLKKSLQSLVMGSSNCNDDVLMYIARTITTSKTLVEFYFHVPTLEGTKLAPCIKAIENNYSLLNFGIFVGTDRIMGMCRSHYDSYSTRHYSAGEEYFEESEIIKYVLKRNVSLKNTFFDNIIQGNRATIRSMLEKQKFCLNHYGRNEHLMGHKGGNDSALEIALMRVHKDIAILLSQYGFYLTSEQLTHLKKWQLGKSKNRQTGLGNNSGAITTLFPSTPASPAVIINYEEFVTPKKPNKPKRPKKADKNHSSELESIRAEHRKFIGDIERIFNSLDNVESNVSQTQTQLKDLRSSFSEEEHTLANLMKEYDQRLQAIESNPEQYLKDVALENVATHVLSEISPAISELQRKQDVHEAALKDKIVMQQHRQSILESEHSKGMLIFYETVQALLVQCFIGCKASSSKFVKEKLTTFNVDSDFIENVADVAGLTANAGNAIPVFSILSTLTLGVSKLKKTKKHTAKMKKLSALTVSLSDMEIFSESIAFAATKYFQEQVECLEPSADGVIRFSQGFVSKLIPLMIKSDITLDTDSTYETMLIRQLISESSTLDITDGISMLRIGNKALGRLFKDSHGKSLKLNPEVVQQYHERYSTSVTDEKWTVKKLLSGPGIRTQEENLYVNQTYLSHLNDSRQKASGTGSVPDQFFYYRDSEQGVEFFKLEFYKTLQTEKIENSDITPSKANQVVEVKNVKPSGLQPVATLNSSFFAYRLEELRDENSQHKTQLVEMQQQVTTLQDRLDGLESEDEVDKALKMGIVKYPSFHI